MADLTVDSVEIRPIASGEDTAEGPDECQSRLLPSKGNPVGFIAQGRWEELTSFDGYGEATHRPHLRILGGHVPPHLPTGVDVAEGALGCR